MLQLVRNDYRTRVTPGTHGRHKLQCIQKQGSLLASASVISYDVRQQDRVMGNDLIPTPMSAGSLRG